MGSMSVWHWMIVLVIVLLLFGKGKIPQLMGDFAKGVKAFKSGLKEGEEAPAAGTAAGAEPKTIPADAAKPVAEKDPVAKP